MLTYDLDPAYLLHEQGGYDVAGQNSQAAQEADQVYEDVIVLVHVQVTALLVLLERRVLQPTVDELLLPQVWGRSGERRGVRTIKTLVSDTVCVC